MMENKTLLQILKEYHERVGDEQFKKDWEEFEDCKDECVDDDKHKTSIIMSIWTIFVLASIAVGCIFISVSLPFILFGFSLSTCIASVAIFAYLTFIISSMIKRDIKHAQQANQ